MPAGGCPDRSPAAERVPTWIQVKDGTLAAGELRDGFVHAHGIALQALETGGERLIPKTSRRLARPSRRLEADRLVTPQHRAPGRACSRRRQGRQREYQPRIDDERDQGCLGIAAGRRAAESRVRFPNCSRADRSNGWMTSSEVADPSRQGPVGSINFISPRSRHETQGHRS